MNQVETSELSATTSARDPYDAASISISEHENASRKDADDVLNDAYEKVQHSEKMTFNITDEMESEKKGLHENLDVNLQPSEKRKYQKQNSTNEKEKQQRIQFKIGKKRKKMSSDVQLGSHHVNVLEEEIGDASSDETELEPTVKNAKEHGVLNASESSCMEEDISQWNKNQQDIHPLDDTKMPDYANEQSVSDATSKTVPSTISSNDDATRHDEVEKLDPSLSSNRDRHIIQSNHSDINAGSKGEVVTPPHANAVQPDGWRVKLYRLNADGSWDDCGTGRIVCLTDTSKTVQSRVDSMKGKEWDNVEEEIYHLLGLPTLCMHAEIPTNSQCHLTGLANYTPKLLLRTRVLLRESYQRQGDNIITWCEPFFSPPQSKHRQEQDYKKQSRNGIREDVVEYGVDLALSFQDNAGCRDIWNKISKIQHKAYELFKAKGGLSVDRENDGFQQQMQYQYGKYRTHGGDGNEEDGDINYAEQPKMKMDHSTHKTNETTKMTNDNDSHETWSDSAGHRTPVSNQGSVDDDEHDFAEADTATAISMAARAAHYVGGSQSGSHGNHNLNFHADSMDEDHLSFANVNLSNPPTLDNLEKIADIIAASQPQQKESLAMFISHSECAYLKELLALFPAAESKNNYHALATLASIIKSILLFNEPSIIQLVASDAVIFEECCCCLEYDPDLKDKANHRWFIRNKLKFRTVLLMEDEELIDSIQKAFRVTYIRDTLLRPTMDESSLSTLGSLLTFTHADVVKGIMCAPRNKNTACKDSYLVRVLRLLGNEIVAIREAEWKIMEKKGRLPNLAGRSQSKTTCNSNFTGNSNITNHNANSYEQPSVPWKQHVVPQDDSLLSRKLRRRGCLSFLREMFNMVRMSLQQSDKDDFYAVIVLMDVSMNQTSKPDCNGDGSSDHLSFRNGDTVNLLSLLASILSDTNVDVAERAACLDILSAIAIHEPSLIRKHCLDEFSSSERAIKQNHGLKNKFSKVTRPEPDDNRQVVFVCPPSDLLLSLLGLMATENDAGIMLETCEVIRIILDTEYINDPSQLDLGGVIDNEEDELIGSDNTPFLVGANATNGHSSGGCELNSFLQMFYDHYVPWLVAPFQYTFVVPKTAVPFDFEEEDLKQNENLLDFIKRKHQHLKDHKISRTGLLKLVSTSATRLSFSVDLVSFCIRAHCYRMRRFLINSRMLTHVMKVLSPRSKINVPSGDRCLKLGALRCLRSIISLKDEFYNRHIIQHSLFAPVFEAFRSNPVGDNLVSSSIIEICEFIRAENIKSLIEYIVTKHMRQSSTQLSPSSSDSASVKLPQCLEDFATPYVDTLTLLRRQYEENVRGDLTARMNGDENGRRLGMSEKALEDQRKFREADEEESYFFDDVDDKSESTNIS